jgi:hypothetical protein
MLELVAAHSFLRIGPSYSFYAVREGLSLELAAVFRDHELVHATPGDAADMPTVEYVVPAWAMRERLDVLGFTVDRASREIAKNWPSEDSGTESFEHWLARVAPAFLGAEIWDDLPAANVDPRLVLRRMLDVAPGSADVALELSEVVGRGYVKLKPTLCADAFAELHVDSAASGPVVVLTEGKTDAEFLSSALRILHPHLVGYVTFLDYYAQKPEGGVGALVRAVKAFAAAGIANRIVAVFDNDTAAADALDSLDTATLPRNVRVLRLPDLDIATSYPTLGPTGESPANVNGLAGSLELYLGRDVLSVPGGGLMPVQWSGFNSRLRRYQGELLDKAAVQQAYRHKSARALAAGPTPGEDWEGLQLVLRTILQRLSENGSNPTAGDGGPAEAPPTI